MNEQSDATMPEIDEQMIMGLILDEIDNERPDLAEAIRLCAIPRWFNMKILAYLRGEGREPTEQTGKILDELILKKLAVVRPPYDQSYEIHKNVRDLLLHRWRDEDAKHFQELSMKAAAYFTYMLRVEDPSREQRARWEREEMYHFLAADEGRGIDLFVRLCNSASDSSQLSTLELLLRLAEEQAVNLSVANRFWPQFFIGKLALLSGDWDVAQEIWEMLEQEQISVDLAKTLAVHLSLLYKDTGEWNKAVECFQNSLEILERVGDERGMADTYINLGFLYKDKEQWNEVDECFRRSLELSKKVEDEQGMTVSLNNLGLLYKDKGECNKAIEFFHHSLEILERVDDKRGIAATCSDLGFLFKDKGEWEKADKYFQHSLEILEVIGDENGKAAIFNSLGFLYTDKKEWTKASKYFQCALTTLSKIGDERRMADTFSFLGFLYIEKKKWKEAHEYFREAQALLENMHNERGIATMLNNLGVLYKRKGDSGRAHKRKEEWEKAVDYFQRSLKIVERVGDKMNAATTMYNIALLYENMKQYNSAIEMLDQVVKIYEQVGHPDIRIRKSRDILERIKKKQGSV